MEQEQIMKKGENPLTKQETDIMNYAKSKGYEMLIFHKKPIRGYFHYKLIGKKPGDGWMGQTIEDTKSFLSIIKISKP